MTMEAVRRYATRMSLDEIENAMVRSSGLATTCRMLNAEKLAAMHVGWMDVLLDEWATRKTATQTCGGGRVRTS